jgi:CubicO group peptidase (beta-lactamase class C family)
MARLAAVAAVLEAAREAGVAPALSAAVLHRGAPVHESVHGTVPAPRDRPLAAGDLFDVASLTKVLATATLAAQAVAEGALDLDAPAARWLAGFERAGKEAVTVRQLLAHASGLPAWRPWHEPVAADAEARPLFAPPAARPPAGALGRAAARGRALVREALCETPLEAPPGTRAVYSDPGFVALGLLLEEALGAPLPALFAARVAAPLGLAAAGFLEAGDAAGRAARLAGRGVAPARLSVPRGAVAWGEVDDDTAWAMGGAAGHAGLFATAAEVAAVGQAWLDALDGRPSIVPAAAAAAFARRDPTPGSTRALGWDTRSPSGSTLGDRLGRGPRGALGHLGFTGCSLWIDLDEAVVAVLLTNHVHPGGPRPEAINGLRRAFHDAVAEAVPRAGA